MAASSKAVQPVAWILPNELTDGFRSVKMLKMPEVIHNSLCKLAPVMPKVPPIASLHDAIGTFSNSVIAFAPTIFRYENDDLSWLYATNDHKIEYGRLRTLIMKWLEACYGADKARQIERDWRQIDWSAWQEVSVEGVQLQKMLLPGLVARWLLDKKFALTLDGHNDDHVMPLRLVPLMTQRYMAELITEPLETDQIQKSKKGNQLFSFVLRLWLETIPGSHQLALFCRTSVRRWMNKPLVSKKDDGTGYVSIPFGRGKSVYLRRSSGYLDGTTPKDVFTRVTIKHAPIGEINWTGYQPEVFKLLKLEGEPPVIQEFVSHPYNFYDQALITMENRESKNASVETGLYPGDHRRVFDDLNVLFQEHFQPMALWNNLLNNKKMQGARSLSQKPRKKVPADARYTAFKCMPLPVRIELHTNDARTVKQLILEKLGLWDAAYNEQIKDNPLRIMENDQLLLEIVEQADHKLIELLPEDAKNKGAARERAIKNRQEWIAKHYRNASTSTGLLIGLRNYALIKKLRWRDPKESIRQGLIKTGRVSQFFVPKGEARQDKKKPNDYAHRLNSAVEDLLRVLGFRFNPFYTKFKHDSLPANVDLVAFHLIRLNARNRHEQKVILPLVLDASFGKQHVRVFMPRSTGSPEIYSTMREGIIAAADYNAEFKNEYDIISFFHDAMRKRRSQNPTLLLLADQNLRKVFPELNTQNNLLPLSLANMLDELPQVRVARLRFSGDNEAPICLPSTEMGKYRGLYAHAAFPNVFYSLHYIGERWAKPADRKLIELQKPAATIGTVQILLNNLQPTDLAYEWAKLVHDLRMESSHTNIATRLPQPLHDALCIEEYLSRLAEEDVEDDLNAIEELVEVL